jgi:prepilin-type N-terminal cleavage/methylation domain-containing protein
MNYKSKKSQKGFTLVERAIVLVIIGLIVSGVLVGQDLIKAAELRSTLRQHQEFQLAVNTFIGKYNGIPGDINGTKYGLTGGCTGTGNLGNGNGLLADLNAAILLHNGEIKYSTLLKLCAMFNNIKAIKIHSIIKNTSSI